MTTGACEKTENVKPPTTLASLLALVPFALLPSLAAVACDVVPGEYAEAEARGAVVIWATFVTVYPPPPAAGADEAEEEVEFVPDADTVELDEEEDDDEAEDAEDDDELVDEDEETPDVDETANPTAGDPFCEYE